MTADKGLLSQMSLSVLEPAAYLVLSLSVLGIYLWLVYAVDSSETALPPKKAIAARAATIAQQFHSEQRRLRRSKPPMRLQAIQEEATVV
ncbi:hypothetical protein ACHHYP_08130 [Achlya hypogyna]|uniref:Uncharacterized protein n=1 Tax=Achlya hypogyna TaxID=1202772 RepID=A0A1V9YPM3_ACHHY|nr:hypothetical protein ACHHYP_08130 [Achlya hypogyna]